MQSTEMKLGRAHIVGPAAPPNDGVKPDAKAEETYSDMRDVLVEIGKRMGVLNTPAPPMSPVEGEVSEEIAKAQATAVPPDQLDPYGRAGYANDIIDPPYPAEALCRLFENSGALRQNIEAMETNIDGFGHRLEPILDFDDPKLMDRIQSLMFAERVEKAGKSLDDLTDADLDTLMPPPAEVAARARLWKMISLVEKERLQTYFDFLSPLHTFIDLRRRKRVAQEVMGNGAWEIIREDPEDVTSKIVGVNHVPWVCVRLLNADETPTMCERPKRKDSVTWDWEESEEYFRRFVYLTPTKRVYFKSAGDPRILSRRSGRYYDSIEEMRAEDGSEARPANEIVHWLIPNDTSPYGIPRWIGQLLSVLGNRASEEVNFLYFDNKAIPPMVLLVSGGRLTSDSVSKIETYVESHIKGRKNFHNIMVIEAIPANAEETSGDIEHSGKMRLEFKPLMGDQQSDAMFQGYEQNNVVKIGRSFRQPQLLTGDARDQNRSCYSEDTETLTENGWKLVDEIAEDERIAAFDPKTGKVVFVIPAKKLVYDVTNEWMYRFHSKHTDVLVTGDHRMLYRLQDSKSRSEEWRIGLSQDVAHLSRVALRVAADPDTWTGEALTRDIEMGENGPEFVLPKVCAISRKDGHRHEDRVPLTDWLEFLGYWISEGSLLQTQDENSPCVVTLSQKKPITRAKIQALIDRLPWRASVSEGPDGTTRWRFSNRCLRTWLLENCGGKSHDKRIPEDYLRLPAPMLRVLYDALMDGDGTRDSRQHSGTYRTHLNNRAYYSKSWTLASQVQQIGVLLGFRGYVSKGAGVWRVLQADSFETRLKTREHVTQSLYTGRVYCFSVPGYGFFVTRRNGKVAIQGNTAETAKAFAEEQIYQPARDEFDALMDRLFLAPMGVRFWRFRSNAPVNRAPDALVNNITKLLQAGAISSNEARALVNDVFSIDLSRRNEDWADLPPLLALALAKLSGSAEEIDEPTTPPSPDEQSGASPDEQAQQQQAKTRRKLSRLARSIVHLRAAFKEEFERQKDDFFDPSSWGVLDED